MSVYVSTFGTGTRPDAEISRVVEEVFDFTPRGMIERFNLLSGDVYRKLPESLFLGKYKWEETDLASTLQKKLG
jgi:S-adenosylmethionine synthetase